MGGICWVIFQSCQAILSEKNRKDKSHFKITGVNDPLGLYLKELLDLDVVGDDFPESDAFVLGENGGDVVVVGGGEWRRRVQNPDLPPMFQNFFFFVTDEKEEVSWGVCSWQTFLIFASTARAYPSGAPFWCARLG